MSSTSKSGDLTFKSTSEIKSFVRHQLEKPGYSRSYADRMGANPFFRKNFDGAFVDLGNNDITSHLGFS